MGPAEERRQAIGPGGDSGSDSTVAVHMAFWKLGSDAICAVTGVPSM